MSEPHPGVRHLVTLAPNKCGEAFQTMLLYKIKNFFIMGILHGKENSKVVVESQVQ